MNERQTKIRLNRDFWPFALALWLALLIVDSLVGETLTVFAAPPQPRITLPGQVVNVVDGDTLDVEFRVVVRVRLLAGDGECWAPETRTKDVAEKRLGLASKAHLEMIALGKPALVDLPLTSKRVIDYMTLERLLADVLVDGLSLGTMQITSEHASGSKSGELGE